MVWLDRNSAQFETHQPKSLFTVFIKNYAQALQENDARSLPQLAHQALEDINMRLRFHLLMHELIERNHRISYFKTESRAQHTRERVT
jgi:hypothetical protein